MSCNEGCNSHSGNVVVVGGGKSGVGMWFDRVRRRDWKFEQRLLTLSFKYALLTGEDEIDGVPGWWMRPRATEMFELV